MQCFLDVLLSDDMVFFLGGQRGGGRAKLVDVTRDAFGCLINERQRLIIEGALQYIALFPSESDIFRGLFRGERCGMQAKAQPGAECFAHAHLQGW